MNLEKEIIERLNDVIKKEIGDNKEIPVAFSGGLDSSIIAKLASRHAKVILYCVGFKDSKDVKSAKESAELLNLPIKFVYLDGLDLKKYSEKTIKMIGTSNKVQVDIAVPFLILTEKISEDGYGFVMCGQGADELFAGYYRYLKSKDLEKELEKDLKTLQEDTMKRHHNIFRENSIKVMTPFLDEEFVEFARKIEAKFKINEERRKHILRKAAELILPDKIAWKRKRAIQYGSGVHKALKKYSK